MRRRVDSWQAEAVSLLRQLGAGVLILSDVGKGCPDILVAWKRQNILFELKTKPIHLTAAELGFLATWPGPAYVVCDFEEILEVLNGVK